MEAVAKLKHLKGSPRKARLVIDLIRGRNVSQALAILKFTDKRAADPIAKTLRSAIANATFKAEQENIAIDPDDLFVKSCFVDMGAHKNRRRMRPAPQGRAYREQRHYCHITIEVSSDQSDSKVDKSVNKQGKQGQTKRDNSNKGAKADTAPKTKKTTAKKAKDETEVKETKKAKVEEVKAEEIKVEKTAPKAAEEKVAKADAEVADAKNADTQQVAKTNETKPADEAQIDRNEELERQ